MRCQSGKVPSRRAAGCNAPWAPGGRGVPAPPPQPQAQLPGAGRYHGGTRAEPGGSGRSRTVAGPLKPVPPPRPAPGPTAGGTRGRRRWAAAGLLRQPGPRSPDGAGPEPPPAELSRTEPPGTALGWRGSCGDARVCIPRSLSRGNRGPRAPCSPRRARGEATGRESRPRPAAPRGCSPVVIPRGAAPGFLGAAAERCGLGCFRWVWEPSGAG